MKTSAKTASEQENIQVPQRIPAASGKSKAVQLRDNRPKMVAQRKHVEERTAGQAAVQMKAGVNVNDDKALEKEADVMGGKAFSYKGLPVQLKKGSRAAGEAKGKSKKQVKKEEKQSAATRSYNNIASYRAGWVKRNDITEEKVREFLETYPTGIRGHASGKSGDGEQGNTTNDLNAYKSWHTKIYGWHG